LSVPIQEEKKRKHSYGIFLFLCHPEELNVSYIMQGLQEKPWCLKKHFKEWYNTRSSFIHNRFTGWSEKEHL